MLCLEKCNKILYRRYSIKLKQTSGEKSQRKFWVKKFPSEESELERKRRLVCLSLHGILLGEEYSCLEETLKKVRITKCRLEKKIENFKEIEKCRVNVLNSIGKHSKQVATSAVHGGGVHQLFHGAHLAPIFERLEKVELTQKRQIESSLSEVTMKINNHQARSVEIENLESINKSEVVTQIKSKHRALILCVRVLYIFSSAHVITISNTAIYIFLKGITIYPVYVINLPKIKQQVIELRDRNLSNFPILEDEKVKKNITLESIDHFLKHDKGYHVLEVFENSHFMLTVLKSYVILKYLVSRTNKKHYTVKLTDIRTYKQSAQSCSTAATLKKDLLFIANSFGTIDVWSCEELLMVFTVPSSLESIFSTLLYVSRWNQLVAGNVNSKIYWFDIKVEAGSCLKKMSRFMNWTTAIRKKSKISSEPKNNRLTVAEQEAKEFTSVYQKEQRLLYKRQLIYRCRNQQMKKIVGDHGLKGKPGLQTLSYHESSIVSLAEQFGHMVSCEVNGVALLWGFQENWVPILKFQVHWRECPAKSASSSLVTAVAINLVFLAIGTYLGRIHVFILNSGVVLKSFLINLAQKPVVGLFFFANTLFGVNEDAEFMFSKLDLGQVTNLSKKTKQLTR
eukprot:snap_masked-scaffold_12-processed-gene-12.36-mRNA-1 protein AED:1.00 eAED:1.00 QI:0/-1/0/0/-1/1/1/0/622